MTTYYVSNAGLNTAPYDTELKAANALATIAALPWLAADVVKISSTHTETAGAAITYNFPTSVGLQLLSVLFNGAGNGALTAGASIAVGAASLGFILGTGFVYGWGITFVGGTNNSSLTTLLVGSGTTPIGHVWDTCTFNVPSVNASARVQFGATAQGGNDDIRVRAVDCVVSMGADKIIALGAGNLTLDNLSIAAGSPTTLFSPLTDAPVVALIRGCDLNANVGANPALVNVASGTYGIVSFCGCKAKSGFTLTTGTFPGPGAIEVVAVDVDSGDNQSAYMYAGWPGTVTISTTKFANASNGVDSFSWLMAASANASFTHPLRSPPIPGFNATLAAAKNATVPIAHNAVGGGTAGALLNSECWVETLAKITSGFPLMTWNRSDRVANILTAGADQDADAVTSWTGAAIATHQKLVSGPFTPAEIGPITGIVYLAKPSVSVYISPNMAVA